MSVSFYWLFAASPYVNISCSVLFRRFIREWKLNIQILIRVGLFSFFMMSLLKFYFWFSSYFPCLSLLQYHQAEVLKENNGFFNFRIWRVLIRWWAWWWWGLFSRFLPFAGFLPNWDFWMADFYAKRYQWVMLLLLFDSWAVITPTSMSLALMMVVCASCICFTKSAFGFLRSIGRNSEESVQRKCLKIYEMIILIMLFW